MKRNTCIFMVLAIAIALLFVLNLATGSVRIPFADIIGILSGRYVGKESWQYIVMETRFPQALTAVLCGASLSVCGLMLQTAFRNPLAGPDVFGISSGAGLGVALVMLLMGGTLSTSMFSLYGFLAVLMAAFAGAVSVTALILFLSTLVRSSVLLLIVGLMVGYVASSAVSLLNFFASEDGVKSYMVWGMGNFGGVSMNHMLLGPQYAESLGISIRRTRNILLAVVGLLTAVTTAFCGPVSFIGLAMPHVARLLFRTENHKVLLPGTALCGAVIALLCNFICFIPGELGVIPLNAVTPFLGAPVILYVILRRK